MPQTDKQKHDRKHTIGVYMEPSDYECLARIAKAEDRSKGYILRRAFRSYVAQQQQPECK